MEDGRGGGECSGTGGDGGGDNGKKLGTDPQEINHISAKWTDEKHSMYLNSIEASFVDHLYSSECGSKLSLGWFSRQRKHPNSSGSYHNSLSHDQFKVQRRGCWENLNLEKAKSQVDVETESRLLSENQWVKHFRSPSTWKDEHHVSFDGIEINKLTGELIHLTSQWCGRDAAAKKQRVAYSRIYRQDSFGSSTEVSDQNFVDKEFEGEEKLSNTCRKESVKTSVTDVQSKDQVVPSGIPFQPAGSGENHACLKTEDAESVPDFSVSRG